MPRRSLSGQIDAALAARPDRELSAAIDRAGNLVAQLRRRIQIDERLDQMARGQRELEDQSRHLLEHQLLPVWALGGLGAAFVLGVALVLAGLFMPATITGSLGWALALLGLAGSGAAGLGKVVFDRSNARQLESCQKQLNLLQLQLKQAGEDRDALDGQLPRGGGPLAARAAAAEKDLAALEELMPIDTRRTAARQEAAGTRERAAQAEQELTVARRRWRDVLIAGRLAAQARARQVKQFVESCDQIAQLQRRLAQPSEELGHRRRELESLLGRITQLAGEAGIEAVAGPPAEQLRQLAEAAAREEAAAARREAIRGQLGKIRRACNRHEEAVNHVKRRRRQLFRESGARDEQEFRRRAVEAARAGVLQQEREALDREITAAIAGHCPQQAIRQQLEGDPSPAPESRRDELRLRSEAAEKELRQHLETRGRLAEQLKSLAEDRRLAHKQLDLAIVEKRLDDALRRWQVLAVTCRILESIRTNYEQQRQPETLQEASGYLQRLTQGRYSRVWTPLGQRGAARR